MTVVIKRYQNRKLYDTQSKRYITLVEIEDLIKTDQEVKVVDNQTGEDITALTLSQVIYELEKNRSGFLPSKLLLSLVHSGGNRMDEIRRSIFNSLNLFHHYDVEIERRINLLIDHGELSQEKGTQLLDQLLTVGQQSYEHINSIEEKIFDYVQSRQIPSKNDYKALTQRIDTMSLRVDELYSEGINKLPPKEDIKS